MKAKLLSLVLAAAILTGFGGFGTYAYFADKNELSAQVSLVMGDLKLKTYWANDEGAGRGTWGQVRSNEAAREAKDIGKENGLIFENVKPGDEFQREIVICNVGSLIASNVIVEATGSIGDGCTVSIAPKDGQQANAVEAGKKYSIDRLLVGNEYTTYRVFVMTVKVNDPGKIDNTLNNSETIDYVFNQTVENLVTVTAEQLR